MSSRNHRRGIGISVGQQTAEAGKVIEGIDADGADADHAADDDRDGRESLTIPKAPRDRVRRSVPRIKITPTAVVAALLVLLLALGSWLYLTRPVGRSAIELTDFDEILSAARSGVVDVTSFDYLTLDQDIDEIEAVTTGALREEVLGTLNERRSQLVIDQQVSSTEVIAASLTAASPNQAAAFIVLRVRQMSLLTPEETVGGYRVEVTLEFVDGRWLLSELIGR